MLDDHKQPMQERDKSVDVDAHQVARRRVIKGLASAVPVVMTVASGHATAQASSMRCVRPPQSMPPERVGKFARDEWHRELKWVKAATGEYKQANVLVYVDQNGMPLPKELGGMPFTHSCYNSFMPAMTRGIGVGRGRGQGG